MMQIKEIKLAEGELFVYYCPDCKQTNGGGVNGLEFNQWRKKDKYSPLNKPCVWCGKGPMIMKK